MAAKRQLGDPRMIRFDDKLIARIHVYQEKVRRSTGIEISFAVAVRTLIEKGLKAS